MRGARELAAKNPGSVEDALHDYALAFAVARRSCRHLSRNFASVGGHVAAIEKQLSDAHDINKEFSDWSQDQSVECGLITVHSSRISTYFLSISATTNSVARSTVLHAASFTIRLTIATQAEQRSGRPGR